MMSPLCPAAWRDCLRPMRAVMLILLCVTSCSPAAEVVPVGAGLPGRANRERYVVQLDVPVIVAADIANYTKQLREEPAAAQSLADGKRKQMLLTVPGFERALAAAQGSVVERWWMSSAVTIEVPKGTIATIAATPGVQSVRPDVLVAP